MATGAVQNFGPWTSASRRFSSVGSSEKELQTAHIRNGLHEAHTSSTDQDSQTTISTMTAAMRARMSTSDFALASKKPSPHDGRHDPKAQVDRMNMFKRQLAANRTRGKEEVMMRRNKALSTHNSSKEAPNSFVTRSMAEALREERLADGGTVGEGGGGGREGGGGGGGAIKLEKENSTVEIETSQIAAEDWPFIYFVVALDKVPVASDDMAEHKVGKPHTAKERQRFLAARKRRIQQSREEMERIRESNIDMGLRLEPIRPPVASPVQQPSPGARRRGVAPNSRSQPTTTPISSGSSRDFPMLRGEYFMQQLNQADDATMEDLMCNGFSQWFTDTFTPSNGGSASHGVAGRKPRDPNFSDNQKEGGSNLSVVELPDILNEESRRKGKSNSNSQPSSAPGSLNAGSNNINRKVHFAEGLPFIKGSGIAPVQKDTEPQMTAESARPETTPHASNAAVERKEMLVPPWSAPVTSRSVSSMTIKSKLFTPMPMPKIDIVSEIYDDLIVKTIQTFLEKEGYSAERFAKMRNNIMTRLSATYPHLARHRAWKLVRKDNEPGSEMGPIPDPEDRNRLRLRPLHQGFFSAQPSFEVSEDFAKENDSFMNHIPAGRSYGDNGRPRWVPVTPTYRPLSNREDDRYPQSMFMSIDGRHIACTPRDDLGVRASTLPGSTSDFRMGPLHDDNRPIKTWTHIIPGTLDA